MSEGSKTGQFWLYLLAYLLWAGVVVLIGFDFLLLRSVISQWYIVLDLPPSAHKAVDRLYIFFAGAAWVFLIFFIEGYFRDGVAKATLKSRLKLVYGGAVGVALVLAMLLAAISAFVYIAA